MTEKQIIKDLVEAIQNDIDTWEMTEDLTSALDNGHFYLDGRWSQ